MTKKQIPIVVVGGSIAGSFISLILAKSGMDVCIIEPKNFPRVKCCGEGLSVLAIPFLEFAGAWNRQIAAKFNPYYGYKLNFSNGVNASLINKGCEGYATSRSELDELLQKMAILNGAKLFNAEVHEVTRLDNSWRLITDKAVLECKQLVLANGVSARKLLDLSSITRNTARFAIAVWFKGRWKQEAPATVSLDINVTCQIIITPIANELINATCLVSKTKDLNVHKNDFIREIQKTVERAGFIVEEMLTNHGSNEISDSRALIGNSKAYLIGDAIERFDPIGGMGMTHALYSAYEAAISIVKLHQGHLTSEESIESYMKSREVGVRFLRILNNFSFYLNAKQSYILKIFVCYAPDFAMKVKEYFKKRFISEVFKKKQATCLDVVESLI